MFVFLKTDGWREALLPPLNHEGDHLRGRVIKRRVLLDDQTPGPLVALPLQHLLVLLLDDDIFRVQVLVDLRQHDGA